MISGLGQRHVLVTGMAAGAEWESAMRFAVAHRRVAFVAWSADGVMVADEMNESAFVCDPTEQAGGAIGPTARANAIRPSATGNGDDAIYAKARITPRAPQIGVAMAPPRVVEAIVSATLLLATDDPASTMGMKVPVDGGIFWRQCSNKRNEG
jgi:hypothetical protein